MLAENAMRFNVASNLLRGQIQLGQRSDNGRHQLMSLFAALQVSASGMQAERTRAETLVENMANAETTRTPEGGPYRRKDVVFSSELQESPFSAVFQNELATGVTVADVTEDNSAPEMRYLPSHPDANSERLRRVSQNESCRRDGGSAEYHPILSGQYRRHDRGEGHDYQLDRIC